MCRTNTSGPGCSKLTASLVNKMLISNINISNVPIFFVEKFEKLLQFSAEASLIFFLQKISVYLVI